MQRPFPRVDLTQFFRLPIILGIEALISGRIIHETCPLWFQIIIWTILLIPLFIPGKFGAIFKNCVFFAPFFSIFLNHEFCRIFFK